MKCPRCGGGTRVTHTVQSGTIGYTQRRECLSCGVPVITETVVVAVEPAYGQGAHARAKALRQRPLPGGAEQGA